MDSISIDSQSFQNICVVLALVAILASLRFRDGVWKRQLLFGIPITLALVGITALLVDGLGLIPYQFPNSYYAWVGLIFFALIITIIGFASFHWWQRIVSVLGVLLAANMAFILINAQYGQYPTLGSLFGAEAQGQVAPGQLQKLREEAQKSHKMPDEGNVVVLPIPGTKSHFKARNAFVWVPPIWIYKSNVKLPVLLMFHGTPGGPQAWVASGFADQTADEYARAHGGVAPIIVMPDINGSEMNDTECVNSSRGNAETYLTVDVPAFARKTFGALASPMAVGGLSEGGMCSMMLTLRHPKLFQTFIDFSGLTGPTVEDSIDEPATLKELFNGSMAQYRAHNPLVLMQPPAKFPKTAAWYEVGTADAGPYAAQKQLVPLARQAGILTCASTIAGGEHNYQFWQQAFKDALPWISYRLKLTGKPPGLGGECS